MAEQKKNKEKITDKSNKNVGKVKKKNSEK